MTTISLCMIVKNEEDTLARCLDCVKDIVDEIVIVDTGSFDHTKEIAKKYTNLVYDFKWIDDFAKARNFSFSKATKEYCMWLDADDILLKENQEKLMELKQTITNDIDFVMMQYHTAWDEFGNPTFLYYRERLIRNNKKYLWEGEIHEVITPKGKIIYSNIAITHKKIHPTDPNRNINIFEKMINNGKQLSPRHQFYYARELYYHERYDEAIEYFNNFIKHSDGWIENKIDAIRILSYCYKKQKQNHQILPILLYSLELDVPRAEICCEIGQYFLDNKQYQQAIFWYKLALNTPLQTESGGFVLSDCYGYIPNIQLCICYDSLGEYNLANKYNEEAGKLKPNDICYKTNKKYFQNLLNL